MSRQFQMALPLRGASPRNNSRSKGPASQAPARAVESPIKRVHGANVLRIVEVRAMLSFFCWTSLAAKSHIGSPPHFGIRATT
jgi:hypothetical protein